ncbi:molybdopterin-dependent oxidoreductase [Nitratireductor indicus]|uniref:Oxidoreductase molybdopterin-binding domain-containing protein n=1 Tax=Nitratireductor indicus C115 TaxID=1231190 RepID=K2N596_9HYPH|nr:molybdopterin-dependent oxidoreductase [Nitratireductor indicus]EKF42573.1 hypothetical protein NA8A_10938 [Nitratireductor indicus C115]MDS1138062.1 molybdopterin-dependent oxidoreductase [Nitratireductor indicus]SFQ57478.1 hypothetical protein SAMN05216176_106221 [Nitratireductor indicus]
MTTICAGLFRQFIASTILFAGMLQASRATELLPPKGPVILTVTGMIGRANDKDGSAKFDLELLDQLPQTTFQTRTIWTEGDPEFTGVSLSVLLEALEAHGKILRMTALNEYAVDVPIAEAVDEGPILASRMNGNPITVRQKGPLWLIYPYDTNPEYKSEVTYSQSVWQLKSIDVRD